MALEVPRPVHEFDKVRLNRADHQWGKDPPKEVLVELGSYEKVVKVKADVAAILHFFSPLDPASDRG